MLMLLVVVLYPHCLLSGGSGAAHPVPEGAQGAQPGITTPPGIYSTVLLATAWGPFHFDDSFNFC